MKKNFDYTIIGAGPMGLYLSYLLSKNGFKVRIVDSNKNPGGHARPFRFSKILIEYFYHFFYKNDHQNSLKWINDVKGNDRISWKEINTTIIIKSKKKFKFINSDSLTNIIQIFKLDFFQILIAFFKIKFFSFNNKDIKKPAYIWAKNLFGKNFSNLIWLPLLTGKFSNKWKNISSLWLFTRIKRHLSTKKLFSRKSIFGYLNNTYLPTIKKNILYIEKKGSKFIGNIKIKKIYIKKNKILTLITKNKIIKIHKDEKIISTIPLFALKQIVKNEKKFNYLKKFHGVGVIVCILKINKKISNSYWTSVSLSKYPFNAIIQQNRLFSRSKYEIVYTSKYLNNNSKLFNKDSYYLKNLIINSIIKIYPHITKKNVLDAKIVKSTTAAPLPSINSICKLPDFKSPIDNFWHAGLEYIYPEDRGVGNSIVISQKIFKLLTRK